MNMAISSAPVSTGAASTATSAPASGSGFAGLLIQAIGGGSNNANVTMGLPMGSGLIGLIGQHGAQSAEEQSQDLLAMLTKLVEQLQNLEQSEALPQEVQDQMAELLNAFQGMLNNLGQPLATGTNQAGQPAGPDAASAVNALQQTLQQLSAVLAAKGDANKASALIGQLKSVLDSIVQPSQVNNTAAAQASANGKEVAASSGAKAASGSDNGGVTAANQTASVVMNESRRPAASLRDPVWRFNVVNGVETTVSDGHAAVVTNVAASEQSADTGSQPAWTFMRNDSLASAESIAGKSGLPAQVPVQQFSQQMEKFLVKQFLLTQGNGTTEAKLTLTPEHLGQVDVRIVMQNGQLTAQFMTDSAMARDLLENQMPQLRSALHGQGLQVERLEVVQQPPSSANTSFMQHDHRQPGSGSNGQGAGGRGNGGSYEDPAIFEAELERTSSLREFGYGSSLNVTA